MLEYLIVGVVLKPQGLKGEIKVKSLTDDIRRFDSLPQVYLKAEGGYQPVKVLKRRYDKGYAYLTLEGIDAIEAAEPLRSAELFIPRSLARTLPQDTYFIADLIGCQVATVQGRGLGTVSQVIQTGSNDVYVLRSGQQEFLIPALKKVVRSVDLKNRQILVDVSDMEGLVPDAD